MFAPDPCCTSPPGFEAEEGKPDEFRAPGPPFAAATRRERGCAPSAFSFSGNIAACLQVRADADAVPDHRQGVEQRPGEAPRMAKIALADAHAPAARIDKPRDSKSSLEPAFLVREQGLRRMAEA